MADGGWWSVVGEMWLVECGTWVLVGVCLAVGRRWNDALLTEQGQGPDTAGARGGRIETSLGS